MSRPLAGEAKSAGFDETVVLDHVSKAYKVYDRPFAFLREALTGRSHHREKLVLRDISLSLKRGEILGIIGRNGAGKSTLLKIIAGTLSPTDGRVMVNGRMAAILELGTGFNPSYSGRDNVILSGLMRGMTEEEIKRNFDSIVAFAGLEDVIDEPFHTYSSGMQARLAFAAATAVQADVIIIDEALAAGDIRFASKSLRRVHEICQSGVTALFVSHTMYHVMQLCTRAIWIDNGGIRMDGDPIEVARAYEYEMLDAVAGENVRTRSCDSGPAAKQLRVGAAPSSFDDKPVAPLEATPLGQRVPIPNETEVQEANAPTQAGAESENVDRATDWSSSKCAEQTRLDIIGRERPKLEFHASNSTALPYSAGSDLVSTSSDAVGRYRIAEIVFTDRNGIRTNVFRFGESIRLQLTYECLLAHIPGELCGLTAIFTRVNDAEPVMYFSTQLSEPDTVLNQLDPQFAKGVRIEAVIDPIQLRAGEYSVSLSIVSNRPEVGCKSYDVCRFQISILANGFDEPAMFYPIVTWKNGPTELG